MVGVRFQGKGLAMESATDSPLDVTRVSRSGRSLAGSLAAHLGLGILCLIVSIGAEVNKYLFCDTPPSVSIAEQAAFGTWFLAGAVIVWLWSTRRRFAWLVSVVWIVVALTAVLTVISAEPARNCGL